ncbi:MAG: PilT/PilU family type 4a pilus ATPase [Dehalococcoidales bacterium]|nr:PilT/PilU family type 4a pilus ATPase [Dehalococcoidales bacterium]
MDIIELLRAAASEGASDVHLVAFSPPLLRIHGLLQPLASMTPPTAAELDEVFSQMTSEKERADFRQSLELDFGYTVSGVTRLRCNAAIQRGTLCLAFRLLPLTIPTIDKLALPEVCSKLALETRGLVIVAGPTGSGKSSTLAAMINHLNNNDNRRVVTLEDPIEYIYPNIRCVITQRELGIDTRSFPDALKHVLRQDPDVIMVGEMRDVDTATAVLNTAETGHLVFTTTHGSSATQSIERIVDLFPPHERPLAQSRLSSLLLGVLCQELVPKADGSGRIVAVEVMLASPAIRSLIREGKIFQLPNTIRTQARLGMELFDQALVHLYQKGLISSESMYAFCHDREEINQLFDKGKVMETGTTLAAKSI